jgi:hypothetical protein
VSDPFAVSLLDAARDPHLLGATLTLWDSQVSLLKDLEDPDVSTHVWALGRGSSKTTLCALAAVHAAALRPDLDGVLARGRTRYVLVAAPGESQSKEFVRVCAAIIESSPVVAPMATVQSDRIDFRLPSGARTAIRALPANAQTIRGMSASHVVIDEHAHMNDSAGPGSDVRVREALDGSTVPFANRAVSLFLSTPNGESGDFYRLFRDAQSGVLPRARAIQRPTWEVRPDCDKAWLERKRVELGESAYAQELGAEFVSAGGAFFDVNDIVWADGPAAPEDMRPGTVTCGLDVAFHNDLTGLAICGESAHTPGLIVLGKAEGIAPGAKRRSFDLRRQREDATLAAVARLIEPYHPSKVVADVHQADAIKSYFGRLGYAVMIVSPTAANQTAAFTSTRARLVDGSLALWPQKQLVEELRRVRARGDSVFLPRVAGDHCDVVAALCAAVYELRTVTGEPPGEARAGGRPIMSGLGAVLGGGLPPVRPRIVDPERANEHGRAGRADPDRPGHVFPGGGRWVRQW